MKESLRREIKDRDKVCRLCGSDKRLDVHHVRDVIGDAYQTEVKELLITLCRNCHSRIHHCTGQNKHEMRAHLLQLFNVKLGPCAVHRYGLVNGETVCLRCGDSIKNRGKK